MNRVVDDPRDGASAKIAALNDDLTKMARLVLAQLRMPLACFHARDVDLAKDIIERGDVVDNLNVMIEEACFNLASIGPLTTRERRMLRSTAKVIANLERAGDAGTHIAKRVGIMQRDEVAPGNFRFDDIEQIAVTGLDGAIRAFLQRDLALARQACLRETEVDAYYVPRLKEIVNRMQKHPAEVPYLVSCLSVLKYLEKIADYTLNIGEQTIFLTTGRRLKFAQLQELEHLVGPVQIANVDFHPYWDGISGAIVARVDGDEAPLIFKEGNRRKIQAEAEKREVWRGISGDLVPHVLDSVTIQDRQALLREFVEGTLLSDIYQESVPLNTKLGATRRLLATLEVVWASTITVQSPRLDYVSQILARLDDVYNLHAGLQDVARAGIAVRDATLDLDELIHRVKDVQSSLAPPFAVWLHGDLNANNIFYHAATGQIRFVDVYRSHLGDYLQDVGVFLVSMDRRPVLPRSVREDVEVTNRAVVTFAARFGCQHDDVNFDRRLKLGLARACITSGRVIVDADTATRLFRRGMRLLGDVIEGK